MPQLQQSTVDAFRALGETAQRAALSRMSNEAKQTLLAQIRATPAVEPPKELTGQALAESRMKEASARKTADPAGQLAQYLKQHQEKISQTMERHYPEAAVVAATGGMALPVRMAAGAGVGGVEGGLPGAILGAAIPGAGAALSKVRKVVSQKELAAKIWNRVAGVKGGRQGTQLEMKSGEFKTLPGRSMVDEAKGPLSQVKEAFFAKPNAATQTKAYAELRAAGEELGEKLGKLKEIVSVDDIPFDHPRVKDALNTVGVSPKKAVEAIPGPPYWSEKTAISVTPTQAHAIRSDIGKRINWNPNVYNEGNEALKDAWIALGNRLEKVLPETIRPSLKRYQESYLFNKALQGTMEKNASKPIPDVLKRALRAAGYGIGLGGAGAAIGYNLLD